MWLLTLGTMSTMVSMVTTYLQSLRMMTPDGYFGEATFFICVIGMVGCGVVALIHTIFFVVWVVMKLSKCMMPEKDKNGNQDVGEA
ncbi:hypothetical protein Hdeb2414_s0008g00272761 [Helianthus debilis subsp. tardiflorus]